MRTLLLLAFCAVVLGLFEHYPDDAPAFNPELSKYINKLKTTWVAAEKPSGIFENRTYLQAKKLLGVLLGGPQLPPISHEGGAAPDSFDSRTNWPECVTMKDVRDQSNCGSCWAFGAVEAMSDRMCSYLGKTDPKFKNWSLSTLDMTACCTSCGFGCQGGYPSAAFSYWKSKGLPTEACAPYPLPKCEHHSTGKYPPCPSQLAPTPDCPKRCVDGSDINKDRYYADNVYSVSGVTNMQAELQKGGPFEVAFTVYQDFLQYKSGIYHHVSGSMAGGHAVKAVGWGVDNGTPYWLIANSWNEDWGEQGYFRILRGSNECGIESQGVSGIPKAP
jgi:cathepsin B